MAPRHPAMAPRHPAMAPRPLPQSWSLPSSLATCNGTQQHSPPNHTMAPCNGTTSTPPKLAVTLLSGTLQWHHVHSPKVGRHLPPQPYHTTMAPTKAPSNGTTFFCTLQWHPGATSNPPKWFVAPPPLLEVRTPIAIAIWGKKGVRNREFFCWRQTLKKGLKCFSSTLSIRGPSIGRVWTCRDPASQI